MGTVFSNRRGRANNRNNHPPPAAPTPAPQLVGYGGYVLAYPLQSQPYYHASGFNPPSLDPQAHYPQGSSWSHGGMGPLPLLPPVEPQKVVTIRNDANLKKETLRLEHDEENPGRFLLAFTFDATVPGRFDFVSLNFGLMDPMMEVERRIALEE